MMASLFSSMLTFSKAAKPLWYRSTPTAAFLASSRNFSDHFLVEIEHNLYPDSMNMRLQRGTPFHVLGRANVIVDKAIVVDR